MNNICAMRLHYMCARIYLRTPLGQCVLISGTAMYTSGFWEIHRKYYSVM